VDDPTDDMSDDSQPIVPAARCPERPRNAVKTRAHLTAGHVTYGHWCDTCNLPSRAEAAMLLLTTSGVETIGTFHYCPDCSEEGATVDPAPTHQ
jgi:hypothetical protein